jgi:hypothetical protein
MATNGGGFGEKGAPVNISEMMAELERRLKEPFHGINIPIQRESEAEWNEDYAVVGEWYFDFAVEVKTPFSFEKLLDEFKTMLIDYFGPKVRFDKGQHPPGTVVVDLNCMEQKIEVHRVK